MNYQKEQFQPRKAGAGETRDFDSTHYNLPQPARISFMRFASPLCFVPAPDSARTVCPNAWDSCVSSSFQLPVPVIPASRNKTLFRSRSVWSLVFLIPRCFCQSALFLLTLDQMSQSHYRMVEDHSRPGKAHDSADLLPHFRLVAMYFAIWTKGFCLHERTVITSASGVGIQFLAFRTQLSLFCMVISTTIEADHFRDNYLHALPLRFYIHSGSLRLCCAARRLAMVFFPKAVFTRFSV